MQTVVRAADRVVIEVNETFLQTLGFTRTEVIGRTAADLNLWVSEEKLATFGERLDAAGRMRSFETELRAKSGEIITVLLSADRVVIGGEMHIVAAGVNITARQRAETQLRATLERLRQSEKRFSQAFHANPSTVALTRFDNGQFVSVNEAFLAKTGYTEAEVIGRTGAELHLHAAPGQREEYYRQITQFGRARDIELIVRTKDGRLRTILASGERYDIEGVPHVLTVGVDITERKEAEAKQQSALERERELHQLKSDFVSLVSHEFRTPLEIIMSSADNLERYHDRLPAEKRADLLRTIKKSVRRMAGMMEEVLLLGRLGPGGTELNPAALDLPALIHRVAEEMSAATARRCPITPAVAAGMAPARGDDAVLRHILTNLLSNAVKYSAPGTPVEIALDREGDDAVIRIADRGCGIPVADQALLFQAFHRGRNVGQIPGTGLGLLIVKRCVELHRGVIGFESTEGIGTTFTVRLPLFADSGG